MIMTFDYLIVGGGMTADAAAKGIRELDDQGSIGIVGDDTDPPYTRPALSKKLWIDPDFSEDDNWLNTSEHTNARVITDTDVIAVDPDRHLVATADGNRLGYSRLLLATGGEPKTLDVPASDRSIFFRTFADYRALRRLSGGGQHIAVVGGGYIGTELAAALVQNDTRVTLIHPDEVLAGSLFPSELARYFESVYEQNGVELLSETRVESGALDDAGVLLRLSDGSEQHFDGMVSGLGIEPRVGLADEAGLTVDNGIVVDERLRTGVEGIYAAGDVACYPDHILGRSRAEHVNNATQMGTTAGRIMAGSSEAYTHTPYFYSNVFDLSWQAVGRLDATLETIADWAAPLRSGVVYYLDAGKVVGILLWNTDASLDAAREVLADRRPQNAATLEGRL